MWITNFIEQFSKRFERVLIPTARVSPPETVYSKLIEMEYFRIFIPRGIFSDWDLHCAVNQHKITKKDILKMERFIRCYPEFSCVGRFRPIIEKRQDQFRFVHFMGFLPNERKGPFFDLHIEGVPMSLLNQLRKTAVRNEEFLSWCIITCWRKYIRKDVREALGITNYLLLPAFLTSSQLRIAKNPKSFFIDYLSKRKLYQPVLRFLRKGDF